MTAFRIPDFSIEEIVQYFTEIQIPIQGSHITKPDTAVLFPFFETLLEVYPNIKIRDFLPKFTESYYIIALYAALSHFYKQIEIPIFTIKDLVSPDSKHLVSYLSGILNFTMYRDSKRPLYVQANSLFQEKDDLYTSLDQQKHSLTEKLKNLKVSREKETAELKALEKTAIEKHEKLKYKEKELRDLSQDISDLEITKTSLEDSSSGNQFTRINLESELKSLKSQIVTDPERLLQLLSEMHEMVAKERQTLANLEANVEFLTKQNSELLLTLKELKNFSQIVHQYQCVADELERKINYKSDSCDKLNRLENEIKNLTKSHETGLRRLDVLNSKMSKINCKIKDLESEARSKREEIKKAHENVIVSQKENDKIKQEKNKLLLNLQEEARVIESNFQKDILTIKNGLVTLRERIRGYYSKTSKNLELSSI